MTKFSPGNNRKGREQLKLFRWKFCLCGKYCKAIQKFLSLCRCQLSRFPNNPPQLKSGFLIKSNSFCEELIPGKYENQLHEQRNLEKLHEKQNLRWHTMRNFFTRLISRRNKFFRRHMKSENFPRHMCVSLNLSRHARFETWRAFEAQTVCCLKGKTIRKVFVFERRAF